MNHRRWSRQRPPWWPADEAWPPARAHRPGYFFKRLGLFFASIFILSLIGCASLLWLIASSIGVIEPPRPGLIFSPFILAALGLIIIGFLTLGRALRRMTSPLDDVMDAAGRVAEGDYAARVDVRGPREVRDLARAFNTMAAHLQVNDEQRRNLMADVAHELRTPLTVIQGNLEGLLDGIYPRDDEHLTSILEETRILSRLIDDLRTLALAESGALKLQKESTDLNALIRDVVASFQSQADAAQVTLMTETETTLPAIEIDPARIREVLSNLLSNALRYTPGGGAIRVKGALEPSQPRVTVAVSDSGAGIAADDLPHIFDRFYKSHDSRGTGLGLTIAKNLVEAHGGDISAQSEPDHGTTICFTLPF